MNYNFTDRVRKVLAMAREEAIRLQHDYVGTEHLLLGLIREGGGVAAKVLKSLDAEPKQVGERIEESVRRGNATITLGELPYTSRAKKVLSFAMDEARLMNHSYVGTEHLLLGLLREEKGIAAQVLNQLGVTLEGARQETVWQLGSKPQARPGTQENRGSWLRRLFGTEPEEMSSPSPFPITIDDTSSLSIYEQIVAQVQEAIATGRLVAGDRLPTVRRLAEELDIAPGTVARAYSELERVGAVVTEGARGTRVAARPKKPLPESERPETLVGLLRPVAVAAFHLGASGDELRAALEQAMQDIFNGGGDSAPA
jgi:DNA-binding transcriptional regulator YhcF (GntR family)